MPSSPPPGQPSAVPLLRELIDIPDPRAITDSDFVLALDKGVDNIDSTVRQYVITDRLVENFDQALNLISAAVRGRESKAAYLHGSFGAGKSHFMAVLHALLRGESPARGRDEFVSLLTRHDEWMSGRKFLMVPYHMLGAQSLEQKVLGGYVDHVLRHIRTERPDAPIPALHRSEALFDNARALRQRMGDDGFIAGLPGGEEDKWGDPRWTPDKLDAAFTAPPADQGRRELVSDLLSSYFPGQVEAAAADPEAYIPLDRGLEEISRHAKDLGYDAVILFLDELILWFANSVGDSAFVAREVQKITNFVEGSDSRRAIPIVSFIARQRDLRELVGEHVTGAAELGYQDTLNLASGRFDTITLEDRNLPEIARRRLLRPVDAAAEARISEAFDRTTKVRREVFDTLLGSDMGSGADIDAFRATYPFSPAFMSTLVHVSSALQRSRTALKLMRNLLAYRRDELRLGALVPLGDLYDEISRKGDQPFTEKLKAEFETAQKLYQQKLRPYLLADNKVSEEDLDAARIGATIDADLAGRIQSFHAHDRLVKTLLLAALAPSVPALRDLTARKLSALNHGSMKSVIPGDEVAKVARKVKEWATQFGEIRYVDGDDPGVGIELIGVDVDSVIYSANQYDTYGARKNLVRRMLWEQLGINSRNQYNDQAEVVWRGSRREIEVIYGNVRDERDVGDSVFEPFTPGAWRLIVDYPFDEGSHSPDEDRARVAEVKARRSVRTVCWIPDALTVERRRDLGRLVVLDTLLTGQIFESHAGHLNPDDRRRAKATIAHQRDALRLSLDGVLRQAYGLAAKQPSDVTTVYTDHLLTLEPGFEPKLQLGAGTRDALVDLIGQMLTDQFPDHPNFDPDRRNETVKPADAKTVLQYVRQAVENDNGRVEVEKRDRNVVRRIANPLKLGEMHEQALVLSRHWAEHFERRADAEGIDGDYRVADLTRWLDKPRERGLDPVVAQLVFATFAEQTDRTWVRHGGDCQPQPELGEIKGDMALRTPQLPSEADWAVARDRAMAIRGAVPPVLRRARLASQFARDLSTFVNQHRDAARRLVERLERHSAMLGLASTDTEGRLHTARTALDLLDRLHRHRGTMAVITELGRGDLAALPDRIAKSITSAEDVIGLLDGVPWDQFDIVAGLPDPYAGRAQALLDRLRTAARDDERTMPLAPALNRARTDASALIREATQRAPKPPPVPEPIVTPTPTPDPGTPIAPMPSIPSQPKVRTATGAQLAPVLQELRRAAEADPDATFEVTWQVKP